MADKKKVDGEDDCKDVDEVTEDPTSTSGTHIQDERFVIKKWVAIGRWTWDVAVDNCAICRNIIMDLCIECQAAADPDKEACTVAWGTCNHAFHYHCIDRWLKWRNICPLDNKEWAYKNYGH